VKWPYDSVYSYLPKSKQAYGESSTIIRYKNITFEVGPYSTLKSKDKIDLRDLIVDMGSDMTEYLYAVAKILDVVEKGKKRIAFGCSAGCGRTSTVLLMVIAVLSNGNVEEVKRIHDEFELKRMCGPETDDQKLMIASMVLASKKYANEPEKLFLEALKVYEDARGKKLCLVSGKWTKTYISIFTELCAQNLELAEIYKSLWT